MMTETYDAALSLLDRQIVDSDGRMVGKVDDVTIERDRDGSWCATELLVGPEALGTRIGGLLGNWMVAVWRRLTTDSRARPGAIAMTDVTDVGSTIHLSITRAEAHVEGFETWLREKFVERLPGAK